MKYEGKAIRCSPLESDSSKGKIVELTFDLQNESVNKFNALTVAELREAVSLIKADPSVCGLLITSKKEPFIVGADITEFLAYFKLPEADLVRWLNGVNATFSDIEDFDFPTVCAINGFALGGGFEVALAASYRVMSSEAKVGLPETKLGIVPGWGGTVRLPRLCGADNAIEWIASGEQWKADAALKIGAVDAVVAPAWLRGAAVQMLRDAMEGRLDWKARRRLKTSPLKLNPIEATMVFEGAKGFVGAQAGPHYPAPIAAIEAMQKGCSLGRDQALAFESAAFAKMAATPTASALVGLFLGDQYLKRASKEFAKMKKPIEAAAVLGAGIMGGGVAYQAASRGTVIYMKDISGKAIELGLGEAGKLLEKQVSRGKMTTSKMAETLGRIRPTLSYGDFKAGGDFKGVDFVVEAVVENEAVKRAVLNEVEGQLKVGAILSSNTSTISITRLAEGLKHPENFCGMHFFNPVHRMPLVEVIRGAKTGDAAVATAVAFALSMGKTPIVVNDCAGFLVNRILFPYFGGFLGLVRDGVDFQRIDRTMEKFGWPMGPAYLLDVVGIVTAHHAGEVMAREFPDRMGHVGASAIEAMFAAKRFGQKNGKGFYQYLPDKKGAPKKETDPAALEILKAAMGANSASLDVSDQGIVERMMLPMVIEASRCLEDKIVASAVEVDLGLIYGIGFPPFRGGALRYADAIGLAPLCDLAGKYRSLGKLYEPTEQMRTLAKGAKTFYPEAGGAL